MLTWDWEEILSTIFPLGSQLINKKDVVVNGQSGESIKHWNNQSCEWVRGQISEWTFDLKKHVDSTKSPYQNVLNGQMPLSIRQTC